MKKVLIAIIIQTILISSCAKIEGPHTHHRVLDNPFPVEVGNWWEWYGTSINGAVITHYLTHLEIVGVDTVNGRRVFTRIIRVYRNDTLVNQDTAWYYVDEDGYLTKVWYDSNRREYKSWQMLKIPLGLNDEWTALQEANHTRSAKVIDFVSISTPAGDFDNVAKIEYTDLITHYRGDSISVDTSYFYWYLANDVGIVKMEYTSPNNRIEELMRYHVR